MNIYKYELTEGNTITETTYINISEEQKDFFDWLVQHGATKSDVIVEKLEIETV